MTTTFQLNPITNLPDSCVVLDTETTGFDPADGHRIVEIGAVRMRDGLPTGETFHAYINPERSVPQAAFDVHGLSEARLANEPVFAAVAQDFLAFLGDMPFVAHNAPFDAKFLNAELERAGHPAIEPARIFDSVTTARQLFPGAQANLDALCKRFKIPLINREKHGALVDSELLADVIVEMGGGRQQTLFGAPSRAQATQHGSAATPAAFQGPRPPALALNQEAIAAHQAFVQDKLGAESLWARFYADTAKPAQTEAA